MVLRLIMRRPGNTLALPRDGADMLEKSEDIPWYFAAEVMDYARIMKGSEDYMTEQYEEELEELRLQEKEDELMFGEDAQWFNKAVASIRESVERLSGIGNPPSVLQAPIERKPRRPPIDFRTDSEDVPEYYALQNAKRSGQSSSRGSVITQYERSGSTASASRNDKVSTDTPPSSVGEISIDARQRPALSSARRPATVSPTLHRERSSTAAHNAHHDSPYFFYEALLHFYLSSLDIRILRAAFGDYSQLPTTILPRVEHISTGHIVDDDLRRRAKYLSHLPSGCEVGFLECDWTDIVSPDILERFSSEIERRRKRNQDKATREEKERIRAEKEEEDKKWAAARRRRPSLSRDIRSEMDFGPLPESSGIDITASSSSPPWPSARDGQQGSAFASLASPSTSPITQKTVWGTRIAAPSTPPMDAIVQENDVPENDGWLQDWETQLLREDEMMAQMEAASLQTGSDTKQVRGSGGGKKKKGKKITLMSTNAKRGA